MKSFRENFMKAIFLSAACTSIAAVALICYFMFSSGLPTIARIGPAEFLLGRSWKPLNDLFGIFPMIIGSLWVTAGAMVVGVPVGLLTAVFLARFCPSRLYRMLKPAVELLAGIPSIVYGFFGLVVIVPILQELLGTNGKGIITASILLGLVTRPVTDILYRRSY